MSVEFSKSGSEHSIYVLARKEAKLTGVTRLVSFDENYVVLSTAQGEIEISGHNMQVDGFDPIEGSAFVSGELSGINYIDEVPRKKKKLWGG